ncbi:MAG: hypothetical protein DRJ26_02115 [Candidatus Methanomethylicota archaeon]|uniref:DUF72 domain-containing protein n=1 Tax=Thermoproteota archaeon TaxID=2056631 RepID=A0A497F5N1_9CREN|nr:MAG: hypothetical protein DRJ26_02115 [Candidatus Verstraetearchaeota archaeon]
MSVDQMKIRIGTSGWDYSDWVGVFYQSPRRKFEYYCKVFNTVEIDSTFYSFPSPNIVRSWIRRSPKNFVFAAKIPRLITHTKELNLKLGVEKDLDLFLNLMKPLKEANKLGPLLFQLPPSMSCDLDLLESLLEILPSDYEFAVEFRHSSWLKSETFNLLRKYGVAYVIVDEPLLPPVCEVTSSFAYIRWHGRGSRPWYYYRYKPEELREWIPRVRDVSEKVDVVYGYFNNHFHGFACESALIVLEMLGILTPIQAEVKRKIEEHFKTGRALVPKPVVKGGLKVYSILATDDPSKLVQLFTDERRLKRAMQISDSEVSIEEISPSMVKAKIRDYIAIIDVENKLLMHNCADFARVSTVKQFCKHLAKLFQVIPRDLSSKILKQIFNQLSEWTFRPLIEDEE